MDIVEYVRKFIERLFTSTYTDLMLTILSGSTYSISKTYR